MLIQVNLLSNLALCYFRLEKYSESQLYNGKLLDIEPAHLKGRYRAIQLGYLEPGKQSKEAALMKLNLELKS